jgi:hypothetical protein
MTNVINNIQNAASNGIIERYSSSSDFWSNVADVCAALVVVGIIAELLELTPKLLKAGLELNCGFVVKRKAKIESWLPWFKKYEARLDVCAFFFWMIIVTALAGELLGTRIARHFDALTTGYLNKTASEANGKAAQANERASTNELMVAQIGTANAQLVADNLVLRSNVAALELQVMETSNNVVKNDPRNAPVSRLSATVYIEFSKTNRNDLPETETNRQAEMTLWKDGRWGTSLESLFAKNGDISGYVKGPIFGMPFREYRMEFQSLNFNAAIGQETRAKVIDDVHWVRIDLNFLPHDSEIVGGSVVLIVNDLQKRFDIHPQNDTNFEQGWRGGFPCWIVATNVNDSPLPPEK